MTPEEINERNATLKRLEEVELRLARIEKGLGLVPISEEEQKKQAQDRWIAGSEPWRDEIRRLREARRR